MSRTLMLFVFLSVVGCSGTLKYTVPSSSKAPGADAKLVADVKNDQNQTQLEFHVENLAPADRVADGATGYVAWYRKNSSTAWTRFGSIKYDAGSLKGELVASAPETSFDFEVSAEKDISSASPSSDIVFSQHVN